ncbi:MAG: hypothetical protein R2789_11670 [Microthrixaceae bacterium]
MAVELAGREVLLRIWRVDLGRVPLYLLDADLPENPEDLRLVTDRLYGGDVEHRLRQELVLGIGGVRALQAVGATTDVFHTNEGHAGFMGLERIRSLVVQTACASQRPCSRCVPTRCSRPTHLCPPESTASPGR